PAVDASADRDSPRNLTQAEIDQLQQTLIAHCEQLKDRVAILDSRNDDRTPDQALAWRLGLGESTYRAAYYPWIMVPDPLRLEGVVRTVPPSGHVAGVYARGDRAVGVHRPPANQVVERAMDVDAQTDDITHGNLNTEGINVIRPFNGRAIRIAGARTLSRDTEWRYINVRRLLIMIEEAIDEQTQWTVFEPNNPRLWRELDRVVRT